MTTDDEFMYKWVDMWEEEVRSGSLYMTCSSSVTVGVAVQQQTLLCVFPDRPRLLGGSLWLHMTTEKTSTVWFHWQVGGAHWFLWLTELYPDLSNTLKFPQKTGCAAAALLLRWLIPPPSAMISLMQPLWMCCRILSNKFNAGWFHSIFLLFF